MPPASITPSAEEAASAPGPVTWTVEGTLWNQQNERGHVYAYGINLPGTAPGSTGPAPSQPHDWLGQILHEHRFSPGRRVRITVELLPEDGTR